MYSEDVIICRWATNCRPHAVGLYPRTAISRGLKKITCRACLGLFALDVQLFPMSKVKQISRELIMLLTYTSPTTARTAAFIHQLSYDTYYDTYRNVQVSISLYPTLLLCVFTTWRIIYLRVVRASSAAVLTQCRTVRTDLLFRDSLSLIVPGERAGR